MILMMSNDFGNFQSGRFEAILSYKNSKLPLLLNTYFGDFRNSLCNFENIEPSLNKFYKTLTSAFNTNSQVWPVCTIFTSCDKIDKRESLSQRGQPGKREWFSHLVIMGWFSLKWCAILYLEGLMNSKREFEGEKTAGSECDIHDDYVELDVNW